MVNIAWLNTPNSQPQNECLRTRDLDNLRVIPPGKLGNMLFDYEYLGGHDVLPNNTMSTKDTGSDKSKKKPPGNPAALFHESMIGYVCVTRMLLNVTL